VTVDSDRPATDAPDRVSADELAARLAVPPERVQQLADLGVLGRDDDGRFDAGDVHRVRLLNAFEEAGVPIDALLEASRAGAISLAYYDQLHPSPGALSPRSYAQFRDGLGGSRGHLPALFTAFGLAEPGPETRLTDEDERLLAILIRIVDETGQPDLALRAIRLFGEGARRAADGALGVYAEAVERLGDSLQGLPTDDIFELQLRPWANFAKQSEAIAGWLASHHMSRAIDEYSVTQTEQILERTGFVPPQPDRPPGVAFVDLTGFTRFAEEHGDKVAASVALQLGELTATVAARHGGRLVKLLGDGVLVRFDDPVHAVEGSLDLLQALPAAGLPSAHAGVESGTLIARDGDIFGRTVNTAARIADAAPDGRLYLTERLARELATEGFELRPAGSVELQGIGPTALVDVTRRMDIRRRIVPRRSP